MKLLNRVWSDIRRGERIDVYVLIFVAIVLAILSTLGIVPSTLMAPVTLGVLALLAVSILNVRHSIEKVNSKISFSKQGSLASEFSENRLRKVKMEATELWMIGVSLHYLFHEHYGAIEAKLKEGCTINVLLRDPTDEMCQLSSRYTYSPASPDSVKSRIENSLDRLCELQKISPESLEIRVLDYPLAFNIGAINPTKPNGSIYVEYHPYKMAQSGLPKILVKPDDKYWFEFYMAQIKTIWKDGKIWGCYGKNNDG